MGTSLLRLLPFLPSAAAAMLAGAMGISSRSFVLGSLASGWVRPFAVSLVGALFFRDGVLDLAVLAGIVVVWIGSSAASGLIAMALIARKNG